MGFKSDRQRRAFFARLKVGQTINTPLGKGFVFDKRPKDKQIVVKLLTTKERGMKFMSKVDDVTISKQQIKDFFPKSKFKMGQSVNLPDGSKGQIIKRFISQDNPFVIQVRQGLRFKITEKDLNKFNK